jgi:hypothetical protein
MSYTESAWKFSTENVSVFWWFCYAEKMVTGLRRVSWEKVDVSFHTSMQRFAAHSIIQVYYLPASCC